VGNHVTANKYRRHDHYKSITTNKKGKKGKRKYRSSAVCWNRPFDLDKKQKRQKGGSRQLPAFYQST
jgi:hypothetical protein